MQGTYTADECTKIKNSYLSYFGSTYGDVKNKLDSEFNDFLCHEADEPFLKKMHHIMVGNIQKTYEDSDMLVPPYQDLKMGSYLNNQNTYDLAENIRNHYGQDFRMCVGLNPWLDDLFHRYTEDYENTNKSSVMVIAKDWYPLVSTVTGNGSYPIKASIFDETKYLNRLIDYGLIESDNGGLNLSSKLIFLNAIPFLRNGSELSGNKNIPTSIKFLDTCWNSYLKLLILKTSPKVVITWGVEAAQIVSRGSNILSWRKLKDIYSAENNLLTLEGVEVPWFSDYHPSSRIKGGLSQGQLNVIHSGH